MPNVTVDGTTIEYAEAGSGLPLVFCHEFAGSMDSWEQQVSYFSRRYRTVAYNAKGYPPSEVPANWEEYTWDHQVAVLLGLLDALGIERAHVCGLSMGAYTAVQFMLAHPERCLGVVAAGVGTGSDDPASFLHRVGGARGVCWRLNGMAGHAGIPLRLHAHPVPREGSSRLGAVRRALPRALGHGLRQARSAASRADVRASTRARPTWLSWTCRCSSSAATRTTRASGRRSTCGAPCRTPASPCCRTQATPATWRSPPRSTLRSPNSSRRPRPESGGHAPPTAATTGPRRPHDSLARVLARHAR